MPVRIGTLLTNIAKKIGVDTNTPEFIELQSANLEVPDSVAQQFNQEVMTFEAAQNNPRLRSHFYATSLNEIDRRITNGMDEFQFPDEARAEVLGVQSTFDRLGLYGKKIKELEEARRSATGQEKAQLTQQINSLRQTLTEQAAAAAAAQQQLQEQHSNEITDLLLRAKLASKKLNTNQFPPEVIHSIAMNLFNQAVEEKGARLITANKKLQLKQAAAPDLDYYVNNAVYTVDQLLDEVLANNNLIIVNDPAPTGPQGSTGNPQQPRTPNSQPQQPTQTGQQPLNGMLSKLDRISANLDKVGGAQFTP